MREEAKRILNENLIEYTNIKSIGHHALGRNHVFLVENGKEKQILKIYSKKIKYASEKRGLEIFSDLKEVPQIINFNKEEQWILMEKLEGEILQEKWESMSKENQIDIMKDVGRLLGKIHSRDVFSYFGQWKEFNENETRKDFMTHRKKNDFSVMERIKQQDLPEKELFEKAYEKLLEFYDLLDKNIKAVICHRDYSYRNLLVVKKDEEYVLNGILDFEHCQPDDGAIDFNTLYQYDMLNSRELEQSFFSGYEEYKKRSKDFEERKDYYMINLGLHSCSWSYEIAKDFYNKGVELLKMYIK